MRPLKGPLSLGVMRDTRGGEGEKRVLRLVVEVTLGCPLHTELPPRHWRKWVVET